MAINTSNDDLNEYNDSLRESINLSKMISDNILAMAGRMSSLSLEGRATRSALSDINASIKNTLKLSDKLVQGKLKQKDIDTQIKKLQDDYATYVNETLSGLNNIEKIRQQSLDLEIEINKEYLKQQRLHTEQTNLLTQHTNLSQQLEQINQSLLTASGRRRTSLLSQSQILRDQLKDANNELNIKEKSLNISERIINEKEKELEKGDKIINSHEELLRIYTLELQKAEAIKTELEKQNGVFGKLGEKAKGFASSLDDVKKLLSPFSAIFEFIKKIAFAASDQVTRIQRGLVVSREEAYALRQGFADAAVASGDIAVNNERMVAANAELGKQLGFNTRFSDDMNKQFVKLTKVMGLSEEAAGGLAKLSKASGMNFEDTKNTVLETTQRLSAQYGIQLDQKDIAEEVGKTSGQTLAMLKGNTKALTEAVAQARLLGTNLGTVKKQASSLLDFETSIENELQAELLTGRQFNLERARSAALTGDLTTAMLELNSQGINFNDFANMNVIAQEKIANMLGMQTDELSDQLLKQQYMGMSREQIIALGGEEVADRIEALNAQDKFNLAMEKMQDIVSRIVGGPLGQFADMMAKVLESSTKLYTIMGALGAISLVKLIGSLATAAVQSGLLAAGSITAASALTFGVAVIAIGAGIGYLMSLLASAKEEATQPTGIGDGFFSKGKTLISTKEGGLFEPSPNDEIAIAPGIGNMINRPRQQAAVVQDNSSVVNAIASLNDTMKGVKEGVGQIYNKTGVVKLNNMDSIGTAQLMGSYNLA